MEFDKEVASIDRFPNIFIKDMHMNEP